MKDRIIPPWFIYFFGAFGGILFGYDIGVMTGALPILQNDWGLADQAAIKGWITSAVMLGAIFGGISAGRLSDKIGRKLSILIAAIVFMVGSVLSAVAPQDGSIYLIVVRVVLGLAVGAASALVPSYMSEMSPPRIRGKLLGINQVMIVSGMLISYIVDYLLQGFDQQISWRLMLGFAAIPALILFLGVLFLPESPRFLVKEGKLDEARKVLGFIREPNEVEPELQEIEETAQTEKNAEKGTSWASLFSLKYRALVIAGIGVAAFQQFQGANAIFYYMPFIASAATGAPADDNLMWAVIQGVILVAGALLFLVIADKFNRRMLLKVGGLCMGLSFILPAIISLLFQATGNANNSVLNVVLLAFICIYVAFYSCTWAPLTWVLVGELFPLAIRGRASGLASSFNWVGSFLVGLLFPIMTASMSQDSVFAIFGVICLLGVLFVQFKVPETRGRTLEEIEKTAAEKAA